MPVIKVKIRTPVPMNTAAQIDFVVYSNESQTTRRNLSGKTVKGRVKDPGGTWYEYSATLDDAAQGEAHVTLTPANHQTADKEAELRVLVDGELCYPIHKFDFVEEGAP